MTIQITILFDRLRWEEKELKKKAENLGIISNFLDVRGLILHPNAKLDSERFGDILVQRCVSFQRGFHTTAFLEQGGKTVINSKSVAQICGNKAMSTSMLKVNGIPVPKTAICFSLETALEAIRNMGFPVVVKPILGSWGRGIIPIKDIDTARGVLELNEGEHGTNQVYYVQEMVERPPRDIRCIVAGDEVIASVYRYSAPGEWRTNVAKGGKTEPYKVSKEDEDVFIRAAKAVGGGILGVDAMESPDGLLIHEVNNTVEFKGASTATSTDIAGSILRYVLSVSKK
ncbi:MAG: lysine biosynthesis protein LysX [Nitrososphaerales archaeon]